MWELLYRQVENLSSAPWLRLRRIVVRRWLHEQIDPTAWQGLGLSPANKAIAILILISVVASVCETEPTIRDEYPATFAALDLLLGTVFCVEYLIRIWVAGERPEFRGVIGRLRYAISPTAVIDLAAIVPFIVSLGVSDAFLLRLFRLMRILTLAKFGRYSSALRNVIEAIRSRAYELLMSLFSALVVVLFSAAALHLTEGSTNPESFGSIPRALWWGTATITKVGYDGAFPVTVLGKAFAALFAIAAVGIVALPTGIIAAAMSEAFQRNRGNDADES